MRAYRITNWDENYEKAQGRKCATMKWFACPNSHDGSGYEAITEHDRQSEIFCAWMLILQVASKMPERGLLVADSGKPLTAKNLAFRTRFPIEIFQLALTELCKPEIGWIERIEIGKKTA